MDFHQLATAIVAILLPYFAKAGEKAAEKVGEKFPNKVAQLYHIVREKFKGDAFAIESLKRAQEKPDVQGRIENLIEVLEEILSKDNVFASSVSAVIREINISNSSNTHSPVINNEVNNYGEIGQNIQIGQITNRYFNKE